MSSVCHFKDCPKPAMSGSFKCSFHKHRAMCMSPGCHNQVYARGLCTRHGGKRECQYDGCDLHARVGVFCSRHGVGQVKKLCIHDGCTKLANARQRCVRHGGRRQCHVPDCSTHARRGGYCRRHSKYRASHQPMVASPVESQDDEEDIQDERDETFELPIDFEDLGWMDGLDVLPLEDILRHKQTTLDVESLEFLLNFTDSV
ncbi:hypothetical protein LEN26_002001 [Aphanomyces euteiches]|nr:hypothetical protein AeMF1_002438 [Aphanomyces euteiches]KAH9160152.1 hypothetical protein LEN26_002001 [Aphanomyces euteiches]KAH9190072.1 hypothetical protein AeNC1_007949 [Aphanomyces euteiches]